MEKRQKQVTRSSNFRRENSKEISVDLLIEIFSRLTIKDLARCRCVSKLWSSVQRRRDFTEIFLKISSAQPRILFTFLHNGKRIFYSAPQHLCRERARRVPLVPCYHMSFDKGMSSRYGYNEIHSPVRGFLCSNPVIYNPSTGEYITIPKVTTKKAEMKTYLGYDHIDKLFKVLCLLKVLVAEDFKCLVSTLGMGEVSWRMIECLIPHRLLPTEKCIDGVLYYLAERIINTGQNHYMVVCFDFRSEKFKFLDVENELSCSALVNCEGKLGLLWLEDIGLSQYTKTLTLWVLEDADELKWSKIVYKLPSRWKRIARSTCLYIVGMTSGGEIVLSTSYLNDPFYILYYSDVLKTWNVVKIQFGNVAEKAKNSRIYTFIDYVENVERMD